MCVCVKTTAKLSRFLPPGTWPWPPRTTRWPSWASRPPQATPASPTPCSWPTSACTTTSGIATAGLGEWLPLGVGLFVSCVEGRLRWVRGLLVVIICISSRNGTTVVVVITLLKFIVQVVMIVLSLPSSWTFYCYPYHFFIIINFGSCDSVG